MQTWPLFNGIAQGHVARQDNDSNAAPGDCGLHGNLEDTGHLLGLRNQFTIMAALSEEMLWFGLLKISAPDFIAWNLRRDGQDGNTAAVTVVEPVDQMQVPGTAAPSADRQPAREMSFRSSGKRCCLFMPHVNPLNLFLCANRVGDAVERVAANTVNLPNSCFSENFYQQVRYFFLGHRSPFLRCVSRKATDALAAWLVSKNSSLSGCCSLRLRLRHRKDQRHHNPDDRLMAMGDGDGDHSEVGDEPRR